MSENCFCTSNYPTFLQFNFSDSCFVCSNCNLNKDVKNIDNSIKEKISNWSHSYEFYYRKWLDSDDTIFEFINPESELNQLGFDIVSRLNLMFEIYYWWHLKYENNLDSCPSCNKSLTPFMKTKVNSFNCCKLCNIVVPISEYSCPLH